MAQNYANFFLAPEVVKIEKVAIFSNKTSKIFFWAREWSKSKKVGFSAKNAKNAIFLAEMPPIS
jgi:hypothetical protein